jgi:hypothetical protein
VLCRRSLLGGRLEGLVYDGFEIGERGEDVWSDWAGLGVVTSSILARLGEGVGRRTESDGFTHPRDARLHYIQLDHAH